MDRIISPLYPEEGAPLLGFCCRVPTNNKHGGYECRSLFKTEQGAWRHALLAHGIKHEPIIFESETKTNERSVTKTVENKT